MVKIIRAGQTCDVWEAKKDPDPRRIAVKILLQQHIKKRELITELKHEAAVAATCKHKNVIEIFEFNYDHELPFIAMELYSPTNVKMAMRDNSQLIAHYAAEIIEQAAEGLAHLHAKGWIHCDVKPDNFLIDDNSAEVKLIDFSIAQRAKKGQGGGGFLAGLLGGKTTVKGTRSYMAPEQIRAKSLDARADVYSLGCVMFELLAGKPPYSGANPDDLLMKHLRSSIPSIVTANERVTPEFATLVQRMMAKDPAKRLHSMYDVLTELRKVRLYRTGMKPPAPGDAEN
jgi:serine/threonine protein kinase